jgi:hypothetical protein
LITIRPSVFCFLGNLAQDLYATVPVAIRRRLGTVPDTFAFIAATRDSVDVKLGTRRPKTPVSDGALQNRLWQAITFSSAAIGNIRVRTDALRKPSETDASFQVVRGGPDIYIIQCLSDPLGWELPLAIAEKIHERNETPPATGRARGIFPLFHLPSEDEDVEREQALDGLRRLERLVSRGVLFPSIVLDRVNRNGYPLERWEDLIELLGDFLALGSASEAAADIWRLFPQVADLHSLEREGGGAAPSGLSSLGLARFRFSKQLVGDELGRFYLRDLKRSLGRSFSAEPVEPSAEDCRAFIATLAAKGHARSGAGTEAASSEIVEWVRSFDGKRAPPLGAWACVLDRLQKALFERLGDVAQMMENARQEGQALAMESPLRDSWIARLSVSMPSFHAYVPPALAGALIGSFLSFLVIDISLKGYLLGGFLGALVGLAIGFLVKRSWSKEIFTLGEFPEGSFAEGFAAPRTLERMSRMERPDRLGTGVGLQVWGELRSQLEPEAKAMIEARRAKLQSEVDAASKEETELVFIDRATSSLRECVETWRARLSEVEIWEPARGFSGDIFPSDGPRRIYEWLHGRDDAERAAQSVLPRISPSEPSHVLLDLADEVSGNWGRERAGALELKQVLQILDDRPDDLLDRLSEASSPLWPRPGDRDELVRCFGEDFAWMAKENDLRQSVKDETLFLRVLGGLRSGELARTP